MSKVQNPILAPPQEDDEELNDYTSVIQTVFDEIYQDLHSHTIRTSAPKVTDGEVGDIQLVEIESSRFLYTKFSAGWFKVALIEA